MQAAGGGSGRKAHVFSMKHDEGDFGASWLQQPVAFLIEEHLLGLTV